MSSASRAPVLTALRERIAQLGTLGAEAGAVLPFGVSALDAVLPGGGLALGAVHEIGPGDPDPAHDAAATLFTAGVAARLGGPILWGLDRGDLFAPGLSAAGLDPERVIYVEAGAAAAVLFVMEEGLRHGGLSAVVGEVPRLPMTASRRLQLAAEASGALALVLLRAGRAKAGGPNAAATRWRITALPSRALAAPGIGRARWRVALIRNRGGEPAIFDLEGCDGQGHLAVPADLADGSAAAAERRAIAR